MFYPLFLLLLLLSSVASAADTATPPVTVVELFTSQGCYSCPPADEFLGELAARENVITLSCHVTYWNYLGWKDTFSRPFCNNRQRQYQSFLKGGERGVYTPQMIINGRYSAVGSRRSKVNAIIAADHHYEQAVERIEITATANATQLIQGTQKTLAVALPVIKIPEVGENNKKQQWQLFLLGTSGEHLLPITSGENGGKQLPYFNPIEYVENKGEWDGQEEVVEWTLPDEPRVKEWVVIAQQWPLGSIVASGVLSLK